MIIETAMIVNACSAGMLAKGNLRPVYWLNILMGLAGTALNIGVVTAMPAMWGILSFMLLNIWVVVMGIKGLYRLRQERLFLLAWQAEGTCRWVDGAFACVCDVAPCRRLEEYWE